MRKPLIFLLIFLVVALVFVYFNVSGRWAELTAPNERGIVKEEKKEETPAPVKNTFLGLEWQEELSTLGSGALNVVYTTPGGRTASKTTSLPGKQWGVTKEAINTNPLSFRSTIDKIYANGGWLRQGTLDRYALEVISSNESEGGVWGYYKILENKITVAVFYSRRDGGLVNYKMFVSTPKVLAEVLGI
jgi:hypothetical protein